MVHLNKWTFISTILVSFNLALAWAGGRDKITKVQAVDLIRVRPGSGSDNIGIKTPAEGNPEGPMSFTLGEKEEIYILDQVNNRVQVFKEGKRIRTIPIPSSGYDEKEGVSGPCFIDLDLFSDGKLALLDVCCQRAVYIMDSNGKVLKKIILEKLPKGECSEFTRIFIIPSTPRAGVWITDGGRSIRVAFLDGTPDSARVSVPGILSFEGKRLLRASKLGDATVLYARSEKEKFSLWDSGSIFFNMFVDHILGIWEDRYERIYLGVALVENSKYLKHMVVVDPAKNLEMGRVKLFVQELPHEIWCPLRVSGEGNICQMALDRRGIFIRKYSLTY